MAKDTLVEMTCCTRMYTQYKCCLKLHSALKKIGCMDTNVVDVHSITKKSSVPEDQSRPTSATDFLPSTTEINYDIVLGWSKNFNKMIQNPIARALLKQHMSEEENVENLLFWEAVEKFKALNNEEELKDASKDVYDQFCSESAKTEVNLDSASRRNLKLSLQQRPTRFIFEEAQQQISKLMERDVYPRFLKSESYRDYLSDQIPLKIVQSWSTSFYTLLQYDEGRRLFKEFLSTEMAGENMLFWEAVQNYNILPEQNKRKQIAKEIYKEFIESEAEHEISIDSAMKTEVKKKYKSGNVDIFNEAADAAYILLKREYYTRFSKSDILNKYIDQKLETLKSPIKNKFSLSLVKNWFTDFDSLMKYDLGRQLLGDQLAEEFADENLRFWEAVQIYKTIGDERERKQTAREIFKMFVSTESATEINIDDKSRQAVKALYETGATNAFEAAEDHAYMLMKRDSFPKFIKSHVYKNFLKNQIDGQKFLIPLSTLLPWTEDFENVMEHDYGRHLFAEFMLTEHADENIRFWENVENYKSMDNIQKRKQKAREIFNEFVSTEATTEINVDDKTRQYVKEHFDTGETEVFENAQKHIFQLMKRDSYPKFLKSSCFVKFMTNVKHMKPTLPTQTIKEWEANFDSLVNHDYGRQLFEEHLETVEKGNLIQFYNSTEYYTNIDPFNQQKLKRKAKLIYQEFLGDDSIKRIELDDQTKTNIKNNLDSGDLTLYRKAAKDIITTLKNDYYEEFLKSQTLKEFLQYNTEHLAKHAVKTTTSTK